VSHTTYPRGKDQQVNQAELSVFVKKIPGFDFIMKIQFLVTTHLITINKEKN